MKRRRPTKRMFKGLVDCRYLTVDVEANGFFGHGTRHLIVLDVLAGKQTAHDVIGQQFLQHGRIFADRFEQGRLLSGKCFEGVISGHEDGDGTCEHNISLFQVLST